MRSDPADRSLYTATRSHSPRTTTPGTTQKLGQPFKKLRFYFIVSFLFKSSSAMSGALARLLFYPTLAYNVFMEKVSSRRWFDRVDDTVVLGALPFRSMTKQLVEAENVGGVITMNEAYETKYFCNSAEEWRAAGVEQLRLSTVDITGVPSLENLHRGVEFALQHREQGASVYVHCKAGRSRSATMAAAYLIRLHCWTPEEACRKLASVRPHILVRSAQLEMLRKYYQQVCGPSS